MIYDDLKETIRKVLWLEVELEVMHRRYDMQREEIEKLEDRIKRQDEQIRNLIRNSILERK